MPKKIKIQDKRKIDMVTGKKVSDKSRFHAEVDSEYLDNLINSANKYGNDPYTAIAIHLAETGFKDQYKTNPLHLNPSAIDIDTYEELVKDPLSGSMRYMAEKFDYAKKLGKTKEEDIIQAWNGYGSVGKEGEKYYGLNAPINMKENPVYGKRIVNLRDSVIRTNPEIVKLVDKYEKGGKLNNTPMKKIDKERYRIVDLYDGEMYGIGGWLDDALIGAGTGAMSGASLGPGGAIAGGILGAITGGIGGNKEAKAEEEQRKRNALLNKTIMPRTVGLENTIGTVMPFKDGGKIDKVMGEFKRGKLHSGSKKGQIVKNRKQAIAIALSEAGMSKYANGGDMMNQDLIELEGPLHEEGGIQFKENAELEGGETVYNDVVNSDSIIITDEIAEQYGLPKQSINKSIAEYSKLVNNKYEGRDVDPFAMKSKEMELNNISQMSKEIARNIKGNKYQTGGKLKDYYGNYDNPILLPQANVSANKLRNLPEIQIPTLASPLSGIQGTNNNGIASKSDIYEQLGDAGLGKNGNGNGDGFNKLMGAAPIIMGGVNALRSILEGPEDPVNIGRVHYDPIHPEFIDPAYQLRAVEDTYATGNTQMQQQSKKDWLRRRTQSATEEAKAKSGILGQVQAANTQMLNQAKQINQQNRMQTNQLNLELGLQEENINSANRASWESNRDYQLNNVATMAGEFARDKRLEEADKDYRQRWLDTVSDMFGGQKYDPATGWENEGPGMVAPDNNYIYPSVKPQRSTMPKPSQAQYSGAEFEGNDRNSWLYRNRQLIRPYKF
jgi:hypothetical protein